jgi:hypothetical protein
MNTITRLWARQPGKWFCLSTKEGNRWRDHFERSEVDLTEFAREHRRANVYFCPHGFAQPRRIKANAVLPKVLWADLDEVDPRTCGVPPTIAIRSSPGRYVGLWRTDRVVTEELNKRLTYALDADKGGWDLTQVLRLPGTINYKYNPPALVRLLWDDGPIWRVADLERMLPKLVSTRRANGHTAADIGGFDRHDASEVLRRYHVRGLNINSPVVVGKRSSVVWKIALTLRDRGAPPDEVAAVIAASKPWRDKFGDNRTALVKEIRRAFAK